MFPSKILLLNSDIGILGFCLFALGRVPPPDLLSTRVPTQGDGISLGQGASTASHQEDSVLSASVSSLELGGSLSGMSLGQLALKKRSSAK